MKRIIIVICSLFAIIAICVHSTFTLSRVKANVESKIVEIITACEGISAGNAEKQAVLGKINGLHEYWVSTEGLLTNYVRKNLIESMSQSISRLYPLAEHGDWASFHSELMSICWQIDNIHQSEAFRFSNIF